jgi:hypothetical protein
MLVAFARYGRDNTYTVFRANLRFVVAMTAGSVLGGLLLGLMSASVTPLEVLLLIASAVEGRPG